MTQTGLFSRVSYLSGSLHAQQLSHDRHVGCHHLCRIRTFQLGRRSPCPAPKKIPEVHSDGDETSLGPLFTFIAQECCALIGVSLGYEPLPELDTEAGTGDTQIG